MTEREKKGGWIVTNDIFCVFAMVNGFSGTKIKKTTVTKK